MKSDIENPKTLKEGKHRILLKNGVELHYHPPFKKADSLRLHDFLPEQWSPERTPLEVEIGCGKGEFIAGRAAALSDRFFVGIDRRLDRHRLTENKLKRIQVADESNWRVLFEDARSFVKNEMPPLSALHVYHPDPWPKARHHKHRFFRSPVARAWAMALQKGGILRISTDHKEYYDEILAVCDSWDFLKKIVTFTKNRGSPVTHFEGIFLKKGEAVYKACYYRL